MLGVSEAVPDPIFVHEPEKFPPERICERQLGNPNRPAYGESKIIVDKEGREPGRGGQVTRPGIGIHGRIAEVLVQAAVKLRGSALGHNPDLASCGAAVFCRVIRRKHLQFLRGIDAGHADDGAIGPRAHRRGAVKRNQGVLRAGSVDLERLAAADREVEVAEGGAAASSRK